ncbi:hypothetical protein [Mucilaginibacter gotjawali]|uniref:Uncharacterized protein n=2 Tax=Mucilaginibacter gotjawali TaxID=1550579 RepID=A0A110B1U2_9SPHI|nr:hypothetical protein [Mucilaginibacter gotjawali]MBB3057277.1 hypothetical protein [Mucilaginibacter gotjawali]BAU52955.1 hypothetical protein MgSA37_01119 [Mucilaginibacter gotjawali]
MRIVNNILVFGVLMICSCQKTNTPAKVNTTTPPVQKSIYDEVIDDQVNFILAAQLPDGPIMDTSVPGSRISPYFADISARALLKKPSATNIAAVKKWMEWYMKHLNGATNPVTGGAEVPGSIYDYAGAAETTNGTYDSVDSYAATFLALAMDLVVTSPADKGWLAGYTTQLNAVAGALERCLDNSNNTIPVTFGADDNDGLSIDSYVHGAKYLMDNAEVNEGLRSMVYLESNVLNGDAAHYQTLLAANSAGIESQLWRTTMYNWFANGSTGATISKWSTFYADAVGQLFPGMLGVIDPQSTRADDLYNTFNSNYPAWSAGTVYSGQFPFAVVSYAAAVFKDKTRVDAYINHILSYNRAGTQKPYWYNAEAAFVIMAASKIKSQ